MRGIADSTHLFCFLSSQYYQYSPNFCFTWLILRKFRFICVFMPYASPPASQTFCIVSITVNNKRQLVKSMCPPVFLNQLALLICVNPSACVRTSLSNKSPGHLQVQAVHTPAAYCKSANQALNADTYYQPLHFLRRRYQSSPSISSGSDT